MNSAYFDIKSNQLLSSLQTEETAYTKSHSINFQNSSDDEEEDKDESPTTPSAAPAPPPRPAYTKTASTRVSVQSTFVTRNIHLLHKQIPCIVLDI